MERDGDSVYAFVEPGTDSVVRLVTKAGAKVAICTLTRGQALDLWRVNVWGRDRVIISDSAVLARDGFAKLQKIGSAEMTLSVFPDVTGGLRTPQGICEAETDGLFTRYTLRAPSREIDLRVDRVRPNKAVVQVSPESFAGVDDVLLHIDYRGDVGSAMIGGKLISDNFNNGTTWEIAKRSSRCEKPTHSTSQLCRANRDNRLHRGPHRTFVGDQVAEITSIRAVPAYSVVVSRNVLSQNTSSENAGLRCSRFSDPHEVEYARH